MVKERRIQLAALNIVTHPHSPENYIELFRDLYRMRRAIAIRGTQHLMIGEMRRVNHDNPLDGLFGRIYRFDQIDPKAPWFNVESNEAATPEELAAIVIPSALKPNLVMFNFVFYPRGHKLYFESQADRHTLGPASLRRFFEIICSLPMIEKKYGVVDVTAVPEHEQLDRILTLPGLSKLIIDVKRPNPDDLFEEESQVFSRLEKMSTRRIVQVLSSERGETIKPDADLQLLARVAANNGSVQGVGISLTGDKLEESTVDRPWRNTIHYDPVVELPEEILIAQTQGLHGANA